MSDDVENLLELERRRCAAIAAGDVAALSELLADDYLHIHMTGQTDDRAGHLEVVLARPRTPVRGEIRVRIYGDIAVLTGELTNVTETPGEPPRHTPAYCHQVAARKGGEWRFIVIQLTAKPREKAQ